MDAPLNVSGLLRQFGFKAKKRLGQNFLVDETILARIVAAGDVGPEDTILEIGPGAGSLTRHLARAARRVIAVELDAHLIPILHQALAPYDNVEIIQGDFLRLPASVLALPPSFKVIANIPYYITAPILRRLLEAEPRPMLVVLTVQHEVAERICAAPGAMSLLAVSVQFYGQPAIVTRIPAGAFHPAPEVASAVVCIVPHERPPVDMASAKRFFEVVKAGFSQKRKQLRNALAAGLGITAKEAGEALLAAGVEPQRRAETLALEEWARIERSFSPPAPSPLDAQRTPRDTVQAKARPGGT